MKKLAILIGAVANIIEEMKTARGKEKWDGLDGYDVMEQLADDLRRAFEALTQPD